MSQIGTSTIELVTSSITFWKQTGAVYQFENPTNSNSDSGRTREAIKNKVTWIFAVFIFGYVGAEGMFPFLCVWVNLTCESFTWRLDCDLHDQSSIGF